MAKKLTEKKFLDEVTSLCAMFIQEQIYKIKREKKYL
jgi:hypothetical protein